MNLFHLHTFLCESESKNLVNAVVEIPKDTNAKYEYDIHGGYLKLDRCLISSMRYPASYGFIPGTVAPDNDPLDVLIYNSVPIQSLAVVEVRIIGGLLMIDDGINDYKLLGIPTYNPHNYKSLSDLDNTFLIVCRDFFKYYKNNDLKSKKSVIVNDEWFDAAYAEKVIVESVQRYKERFAVI